MNSSTKPVDLKDAKNLNRSSMYDSAAQNERENEISSPLISPRRRQKEIFLTRKPVNVIEEAKQELHEYIDVMDGRIEKYV